MRTGPVGSVQWRLSRSPQWRCCLKSTICYRKNRQTNNIYHLGSINGHNIIISGLPQTGNCSAAAVVAQMRMAFPNLRYGLLVGIGGSILTAQSDSGTVRLGHVVVSKSTGIHSGAIQYDRGRAEQGQFQRTGVIASPPQILLNAAQALAVQRGCCGSGNRNFGGIGSRITTLTHPSFASRNSRNQNITTTDSEKKPYSSFGAVF